MIEKSAVIEILNGAFRPFDCYAELIDYENGVRFGVYDRDGNRLVSRKLASVDVLQRNAHELADWIGRARDYLRENGHHLDPWSMPAYPDSN